MTLLLIDKLKQLADIATDAGHVLFGTAAELFWVEVEAADGHRTALRERLDVLRDSRNPTDAVTRQLDLLPESRRRVQRTRMERAHTLSKFARAMRELAHRARGAVVAGRHDVRAAG